MNDELQLDLELDNSLFQDQTAPTGSALFTNSSQEPEQVQQPSTEGQERGNFVQEFGKTVYEGAAPVVGLIDTLTDVINLASADGGKYDIPKLPKYESNTAEAIRNISGLVIPSLGLRAKLLQAGAKAHAAGQAAPWLQRLGNSKSFEWFAKFGADIGTGATVDYIAKQNQQDDNVFGVLKNYFPKTYQWIPDSWATNADDSPGEKRAKNISEGAIFNVLAGIVEGAAYLIKGGRSIKRTSKFIGKGGKEVKIGDEFSDIKFSDTAIEDNVLRGYARKEKELNLLNEYYISRGEPAIDWNQFDEGETLVRTKDADGIVGAAADAAQIQNNIDSSWGRIGNLVHEAARKEGIELQNLSNRTLVSELSNQLKQAGPVSKRLKNTKIIFMYFILHYLGVHVS